MTTEWKDYASQATERWLQLGASVNPVATRAGIRLERVGRRHEQMLNDALSPFKRHGIRSIEDFRLLALLTRIHPEATSATASSRLLGLTKAATSTRIDRFVNDGLAERSTSEFDRRTVEVRATTEGIALATDCVNAVGAVHERLTSALNPEQMQTLENLLAQITSRFV